MQVSQQGIELILTQEMFDALVSLTFNMGGGNSIASELVYAITAIGLGTPISKGIVDYKREVNTISVINDNQHE